MRDFVFRACVILSLSVFAVAFALNAHYDSAGQKAESAAAAQRNEPELSDEARKRRTDEEISLYTFWLMIFTGVLSAISIVQIFFLTRADKTAARAANAASRQADALIGVEIARLRVFKIDLSSTTGLQFLTPKVERAAFEVEFMNYGRTPAFLTGGCGRTHVGKTLPTEPQHAPAFHFASTEVIEAGRKWTFPINAFGGRMTKENAADVLNDRTNLWIYGYIEFTDFQHRHHREPFLWQFFPHKGVDAGYVIAERDGPEAYTRRW
jgi:hypothetical protein